MGQFFDAACAYFKAPRERPKMPEIIEPLPRAADRASACSRSTARAAMGAKRVSNYEIAELRGQERRHRASPSPRSIRTRASMGAREARDLIENHGVKGFKFHGIMQNIHPADPLAYPIYEVIAEYKLPAIFHTGHSGMGTGHARRRRRAPEVGPADADRRRRGRLPRHEDHPRAPELAVGRREPVDGAAQGQRVHRPLRLEPEVFPAKQVIQYANTQLKQKMMFGTRLPADPPRQMAGGGAARRLQPEVLPGIMKDNAARLLGLSVSEFAGRHVLVTGASSGIGLATARMLAAPRRARVADRAPRGAARPRPAAGIGRAGGTAAYAVADVADRGQLLRRDASRRSAPSGPSRPCSPTPAPAGASRPCASMTMTCSRPCCAPTSPASSGRSSACCRR